MMIVTTSIGVEFLDPDLQIEPMNPTFHDTSEVPAKTLSVKLVTIGELVNLIERDHQSLKNEDAVMQEVDSAMQIRRNEAYYVAVVLHFERMPPTPDSIADARAAAEVLVIGLVL